MDLYKNNKRTFSDVINEHITLSKMYNLSISEINYIDEDDTEKDYILLSNYKKQKINHFYNKKVTFNF